MTRLRKMMLEDLERRNYSAGTTHNYLRFVERFAQHFGKSPDKLGPDHLSTYQAYLLRERTPLPECAPWHCPRCGKTMRVVHRFTAQELYFRGFDPS
ncbi:MAG TPA: phage integrase N-terminal SAM-like domain-containing protein [Terracidiphilus sp.]|nr:phage integrase N-terminal SAM-like domain-containing protein [Terracidiphilus sp.]